MAGEEGKTPEELHRLIAEWAKLLAGLDVHDQGRVIDTALLDIGSALEVEFNPATGKLRVK